MGSRQGAFAPIDSFPVFNHDPKAMSLRPCPVCGADETRPVLGFRDFQFFSDDSLRAKRTDLNHVLCRRCFALYLNPCFTPMGFAVLFEEAGMSYGASDIRRDEQLDWLDNHDLLKPGSTYLDVGCHDGGFLAALPETIKGVGVDIDEETVQRARKKHDQSRFTFVAGDFERLDLDTPVDVITLFHVLEHLPRPRRVLARLRALATPRTHLVVEVPILESAATNDINGFLTPMHLTHFSIRTLHLCMVAAGWKIETALTQEHYNGYRIIAVPTEPRAVPGGDPRDLCRTWSYLAEWYGALKKVCNRLSTIPTSARRVIWGGGMHTEMLYHLTPFFQHRPDTHYIIADSDPLKHGRSWRGLPIVPPTELKHLDWRDIHLLISSYGHQEAIAQAAVALDVPAEHIHRLYDSIRRY
jgi:hypothetical protein